MSSKKSPCNKIHVTAEQEAFIRSNFWSMDLESIGQKIGLTKTRVYLHARKMGLHKTDRYHWTKAQTHLLLQFYKYRTNLEISRMLNEKFPDGKVMNRHRVRKKMDLLGLKRTEEEERYIKKRVQMLRANMRFKESQKNTVIVVGNKTRILVNDKARVTQILQRYSNSNIPSVL
jgi:hypothetical protein